MSGTVRDSLPCVHFPPLLLLPQTWLRSEMRRNRGFRSPSSLLLLFRISLCVSFCTALDYLFGSNTWVLIGLRSQAKCMHPLRCHGMLPDRPFIDYMFRQLHQSSCILHRVLYIYISSSSSGKQCERLVQHRRRLKSAMSGVSSRTFCWLLSHFPLVLSPHFPLPREDESSLFHPAKLQRRLQHHG
jgi:hypothetical protein